MITSFYKPSTFAEAVEIFRREDSPIYLGGGTIVNSLGFAKEVQDQELAIISLAGLPINNIELSSSELVIGAGVTIQDLIESDKVFPAIKEAAKLVVNRNVRNIATVGGNVAFHGSSCNIAAMLLAMDVQLELHDGEKTRLVSFTDYHTHHEPYEIIVALHVPRCFESYNYAVRRYVRTQNDISILLAYALAKGNAEKIEDLRLVMGGVDEIAVHLTEIESLKGQQLPTREDLASKIHEIIHPLADLRGSVAFKKEVGAQIAAWVVYKALGQL
ncbi:FAD binding domain-containing protein [bacterium]|nr:FAD binding domain-containing protein [bacterium]